MHDETVFQGGVFSDTIEGGRAGAQIELRHDAVVATTTDREVFSVSYFECGLEIGGFNDKMVFCRNPDRSLTIFTEDRKFAAALSRASRGILDQQLDARKQKVKRASRRARNFTLGLVFAIVVACMGIYFGIRAAGSAAVHAVPLSVDKQIGDASYASMELPGDEIQDPTVVAAVQQIVDRLAPHAAVPDMEFEVHVVQADQVNAFCLPGGIIVVFTGLIEQADKAEQVAGVLAHEMAHATLRHGLERISQSLGLAAAVNLLLGDVQGLVVLGSELFQLASINSYSRGQETEADLEGVRMLHAAAIDPHGLAEFFEILKQEGNALPGALVWISTHPDHDVRIHNVEAEVSEFPKQQYQPLDIDWEAVKKQVAASE